MVFVFLENRCAHLGMNNLFCFPYLPNKKAAKSEDSLFAAMAEVEGFEPPVGY